MNAYLLNDPNGKLWLAFGEDCVQAAEHLVKQIGGNYERFSVGGSWEVNPDKPIDMSQLWPYFTNQPGRHSPIQIVKTLK